MEVILLADVANLGEKDEIVKVKPGFANNYLIPQGYALTATPSNVKVIQENNKQAAHRQEKIKEEARQQAELINALMLRIPTLVGKEGKIYGTITPLQLANQLKESGFDIDRRKILITDEIKSIGEYTATISLHKEVKASLRFVVVGKDA